MYEYMAFLQGMALENELKRQREPLEGAEYSLHDPKDVTRVDTEPALKGVEQMAKADVKQRTVASRASAMLNLVRLSFE